MNYEVKEHSRNSHSIVFKNGSRQFKTTIAILSDLHWDNPDCDRDLLKKDLDYCVENDIPVLLNGDTFCLMQGKYDPRSSKNKIRPEHAKANYLDAVVETAVEWFTPYAEIITLIGYGNHETSILRRQETDVIQRFVSMLNYNAKPTQPVYVGGYGGSLSIYHKKGSSSKCYNIHYFHGSGGGGIVTRGSINITRMLSMVDNYDCVTMGHVHENKEELIVKNRYSIAAKKHVQAEVLGLITGTYKDEYKDGYMGWHVERGAPAKPLGGRLLDLHFSWNDKQPVNVRASSRRL